MPRDAEYNEILLMIRVWSYKFAQSLLNMEDVYVYNGAPSAHHIIVLELISQC